MMRKSAFNCKTYSNIFVYTGKENNARIIWNAKVKQNLSKKYDLEDMLLVWNALLGLHGFTGCDTVSATYGKGGIKLLKLMLKDNVYKKHLQLLVRYIRWKL